MKIGFFSGSDISIPFLEAIIDDVALVVTLKPKVRERGNTLTANPVKIFAENKNKAVLEIETFTPEVIEKIQSYNLEAFVVFSFGKILPKEVLELVKCPLNIHPSNLPFYRGASPIERQLMDGVTKSAVTIFKMSEKIDKGEIIAKKEFDVTTNDDYFSFLEKVYRVGIPLLRDSLSCCLEESCSSMEQKSGGNYAKKIRKEEEIIGWNNPAASVHNKVRALTRIGAYTCFRGKKLKVFKSELTNNVIETPQKPGSIVLVTSDSFVVACSEGAVKVLEVQLENKKRMSSKDFINGYKPKIGEVLNEDCSPYKDCASQG